MLCMKCLETRYWYKKIITESDSKELEHVNLAYLIKIKIYYKTKSGKESHELHRASEDKYDSEILS